MIVHALHVDAHGDGLYAVSRGVYMAAEVSFSDLSASSDASQAIVSYTRSVSTVHDALYLFARSHGTAEFVLIVHTNDACDKAHQLRPPNDNNNICALCVCDASMEHIKQAVGLLCLQSTPFDVSTVVVA